MPVKSVKKENLEKNKNTFLSLVPRITQPKKLGSYVKKCARWLDYTHLIVV